MESHWITQLTTERHQVGYALIDEALNIVDYNSALPQWAMTPQESWHNTPVTEMFPELFGSEETLQQMVLDDPTYLLPVVHRQLENGNEVYIRLEIERTTNFSVHYILTVTDITHHITQEQAVQQQRNELKLLTGQVSYLNDQLAYVLKRFVPEKVAENIIRTQKLPQPGGEMRANATLLFADMRNFTGAVESLSPEGTLDLLNQYLTVLAEPIWEYDGSVIQIVGDMIMASFNVPSSQPDHALRAIKAAWDMKDRIETFIEQGANNLAPLRFGYGIHTGIVTAGYLGVKERYRYAVVSDATNVAFHLCSRALGGQVILSQTTLNELKQNQVAVSLLGEAQLKRRKEALPIYQLDEILI